MSVGLDSTLGSQLDQTGIQQMAWSGQGKSVALGKVQNPTFFIPTCLSALLHHEPATCPSRLNRGPVWEAWPPCELCVL